MSGTLPNRFMIERRYGPSNCDWLHEESKDVPVWTLCAKHALIFKSLAEAAQKLKEIKASAKSWPNRDFFSFAIIEAAASGLAISPPSSPSPSPESDMPRYRASRFINTREADSYDFSAANGQEALETLLSGDNLAWSGDADLIDCDVPGEILALDRRKNDGSYETVAEEIQLPGQKPYGQPSRDFVWKTAKLGEEGAYSDAIETSAALIEEARALCVGGNRAQREEIP